ncbi:MAG: bifunctional phosphoglucose/phosphomannose isomerase [Actinomycetota bacterium]|nr:bifunctional phosphoglucose/phosphomannose isomerase [Actinomycetota bacterium]
MIDLDDVEAMEALDSLSILDDVEAFPRQCRDAWRIAEAAEGLPSGAGADSVLVVGMGGSGISGNLAQAVVEPHFPLPWRVIKGYGPLPDWVGRNTCVFVMSYSGATEESLAAFEDAAERRCRIVIISSGGALTKVARDRGAALVRIPEGLQPRASLGYLCLCLLGTLRSMQLAPDMNEDFAEAMEVLDGIAAGCGRDVPTGENPAKTLAGRLYGRVPVIYGGYGVGAAAAQRFKTDLNEYGKSPAFYNVLPELNHNEIVGWNRLGELTSASFVVVLLRDLYEDERVALRFSATSELIAKHVSDVVEVHSEGRSPLARVLSFALITQLAAVYLGFGYGVDPGPVEAIEKLKSALENNN